MDHLDIDGLNIVWWKVFWGHAGSNEGVRGVTTASWALSAVNLPEF